MFGGKIEMLPERPGNRMSAAIDTSRSKELGWQAKVYIKDYIARFIQSLG